jgi:hypothetical protein
MRLREAYAEDGRERDLTRLLSESYPAFTQVLRGALHLTRRPIPDDALGVARGFCQVAGLDDAAFAEVDGLRRGKPAGGLDELFGRYYRVLEQAADFIDRHVVGDAAASSQGESS